VSNDGEEFAAPIKREHVRMEWEELSRVFIYCDDPGHPPRRRRVAVTNFYAIGDGRWTEHSTGSPSRKDSGTTLADDSRLPPGSINPQKLAKFEVVRSTHELVCCKCKARPMEVREDKLFRALNAVAAVGESEVSLSELAAIVETQSDMQGRADPEAGQG